MKKQIITKETLFPRSYERKKEKITVCTQPYVSGLYVAGNLENGRNVFQSCLKYKQLKKFVKKLQKDTNTINLNLQPFENYLSESDLNIIN